MEKTKLGIPVNILGAVFYLLCMFGGYIPAILIAGYILIRETDEKEWNGFEVLKVWFPDGHQCEMAVAELKRGDMIQITWNRKGKPVELQRI